VLTLKTRLRERLRKSKNIILILSCDPKESRALKEEIEYGGGELGLPIIIVYPELNNWQIGSGNFDKDDHAYHERKDIPIVFDSLISYLHKISMKFEKPIYMLYAINGHRIINTQ